MMLINLHQCCRIKQWKAQLFAISNRFLFIYFYFWWYTLMGNFTVSFNSAPATLFCSLISLLFSSSFLYQFVAHWSRVASSFCCRLNRLVLDDRSKILTTSGEKQDAQPGRQRRRPDRSTGLHRRDAPLDKGEPCLTARVDQVRISPSASY